MIFDLKAEAKTPRRNTEAGSFRQLRQFHHVSNSDKVFGTHRAKMYAGMFDGADLPRMAHVTAQIDDMIYTQPVMYEFSQIKVPVLLIIGGKDRTALGRDLVSPEHPEYGALLDG